jgi:hypothetical protein
LGKKSVIVAVVVSLATLLIGYLWKISDPANNTAFILYFGGWIASLIVVGYVSTPTDSLFGKISFVFVIIMVVGIACKITHFPFANTLIIVGLAGIMITYAIMWLKSDKA